MGAQIEIRDAADLRLADFRDLTRADRRPDRPGGAGLVIAEGVPVVRRLLSSPYRPRAVLGVAGRLAALASDLAGLELPVYVASPHVMAATVGFHLNRGVLASADRVTPLPAGDLVAGATRIVILEGVNDHENLGSLFRNAAALGVEAVLLGPGCADPLYRRAVRVSMGHVLSVPFTAIGRAARAPAGSGNGAHDARSTLFASWPGAISALTASGFTVLAMTPQPGAITLRELDPVEHPRTAVLVGAEGPGLSAAALQAADLRVRIPMRDGVDSLNVATAAAIAFTHLSPPEFD